MKPCSLPSILAVLLCGCGTASTTPTTAPDASQAAMEADGDATDSEETTETVAATTDGVSGLQTSDSSNDFATTVAKAKAAIESRGLKLMAQVDHAGNAKGVGMELRPTTVFLFGNPKAGTQLMAMQQTAGIDLPMKLIVWQDGEDNVHVGYNDPAWIAERHGIAGKDELVGKMQGALSGIASEAAAK